MDVSQHVRAIISFIEAAELSSFSAAAKKLGISSAAVSKNIAGLEQALGVRLMNRTTRKVTLTEEGNVFLSQAKIAVDALENAVDSIVATKMETSGHVRISTSGAFGRDQLLPALPGLMTHYPRLSVEVDFDDRVIDLINDGYDIAIRGGRIIDSSLITRPVCRLNVVLVASPEHLKKYGNPTKPEDLVNHRLIARKFLGGKVTAWGFKRDDGSLISINPEPSVLTLSAPEALVQAAVEGIGITQVGVHHAIHALKEGKLNVVLLEQHDPGNYELVIQYPHRALIAPRVKATVEYLLASFKNDKSLHFPIELLAQYKFL
ncbi:LysR family transcriptional regulator [Vibrio parahaemolyticus]|uniref:LysR family transcriptional regulator n=1 Tax=Vibrio parahaemolyticus TaxID=670 RepID=UPI00111E566D|nr:LysR family transcriptional regulator [Vibrio parahaemolyticus]TOP86011.1 transcriptional regulator [Vibrio parahaemolyticus]